jgi:hypothetical protein
MARIKGLEPQQAGWRTRLLYWFTREVFDALRRHFTPQQLVELTSAIAWENFRARFNRAFAVEAEGFAECGVCAVPTRVGA